MKVFSPDHPRIDHTVHGLYRNTSRLISEERVYLMIETKKIVVQNLV